MTIEKKKKQICVIVTEQDFAKLSQLAEKTGRTVPGYMRWLLHQHFYHLNKK